MRHLEDAIYKLQVPDEKDNAVQTVNEFYNEDGNLAQPLEIKYASVHKQGRRVIYKVLCNQDTSIVDPQNKRRTIHKLDFLENKVTLKEVNERCFRNYLNYLQTKKESFLRYAERTKN